MGRSGRLGDENLGRNASILYILHLLRSGLASVDYGGLSQFWDFNIIIIISNPRLVPGSLMLLLQR